MAVKMGIGCHSKYEPMLILHVDILRIVNCELWILISLIGFSWGSILNIKKYRFDKKKKKIHTLQFAIYRPNECDVSHISQNFTENNILTLL